MNALHALGDASLLLVAPLIVLAGATVAHTILTRVMARRQARVMRTAIGTSRPSLVRQLLVEDIALSIVVGAAGLLLGAWHIDGARATAAIERELKPHSPSTVSVDRRTTACHPRPNRLKT